MSINRLAATLGLACLPGLAAAGCTDPAFTAAQDVQLGGEVAMIVTHASAVHDARLATKRGADEALRFARERRIPVAYLQDDSPTRHYLTDDCEPDYWVRSEGGELSFEVTPPHLYILGGHLEMCLSTTLHEVLLQWARRGGHQFTVTYLMDAIYSNGKGIDETDPFFADFQRFMGVVTHGRPGGEHWPKLTLLETMGIILREDRQLAYLERILPHWERSFTADYRVELRLGEDGPLRVLQPGAGLHAPRLRFEFVDSALELGELPTH